MSITGISNYGLQNVTNEDVGQAQYTDLTSRVEQAETDIEALEAQVGVNETDIGALDARVDTLETEMNAVEAVNTTQNTNISSILQRITDINYSAGSDLTTVANRLIIRAALDSTTSAAAQLTLFNQSAEDANKVQFSIFVGPENNAWNALTDEGDALMLIRNQSGISNTYFGGFTFCTHGGLAYRFSFDPTKPCIFQNSVDLLSHRIYTTGNMASGTFTLGGVDLGTTLSTLNTSVANNTLKLSPVTYFHAPAIPGVTPEVESYTLDSLQIALNGEVTINGRNVLTELTDLSAEVAAIDHHLLTEDLDCAGFNINDCGTLTADVVMAGGYNVKNRIVTLETEVQALEDVDHNTAPADLNMNGFNIVNNRQLQLVTGIKSATLSVENVDDLEAKPPLNGNFVVSTSVSGAGPKSFTLGHEVVDFNGRMITNASFYLPEERAQQEISILEDWVIQPFTFGAGTSLQGGNVQWRLTGTSFGLQLSNETTTALSEHTAQHPGVIHMRLRYSPSGNDSNGTLTWHSEQGVHSSAFTTGRTIFKIGDRPPGGLGVNVYPDFRVKIGLSNDTGFASAVHWDCDANGAWKLYVNGTVVYTSTVFLNFTAGSWMSVYFVRITGGIRGVIELADHSAVDSYDFIGSRPGKFKPMISLIGNNTFVSGLPDRDLYLDYTDFQYSATRV